MERLHSRLSGFLTLLEHTALGVSTVLAWSYVVSLMLPSCPTQEGGIVVRLLYLPLGYAGTVAWTLLLIVASWGEGERRAWFVVAAVAAGLSSLLLRDPALLAALSAMLLGVIARESIRACAEAVALGVIATEVLTLFYLLVRAYAVELLIPAALPLHLSLYCALTPLAPLIVLAVFLSPLAVFPRRRKLKMDGKLEGRLTLFLGLVICCLLWVVLYASELNRSSKLIGVDSNTRYYPHALQLLAGGLPSVLKIGYDRPLYYLILYWLARSLGPVEAVKVLPLMALSLYTVASYFATKELAGKSAASLAPLIAPLTYNATAGLYGGLYANWTALSVVLLATTSAARWLMQGKALWLVAYLILLASSVTLHIYLGAVFLASCLFLMFMCLFFKGFRRRALIALIAQLALTALGLHAADKLSTSLSFHPPSHVVFSLARSWWSRVQRVHLFSQSWWRDFSFAIYNYAATAALDPTVWVFTALSFAALKPSALGDILLVSWLVIAYLLSLTAPFELMWRALYNYPFSVSEAIGLTLLLTIVSQKFGKKAATLWLTAILLFKLSYTLAFAVGLAS